MVKDMPEFFKKYLEELNNEQAMELRMWVEQPHGNGSGCRLMSELHHMLCLRYTKK